MPKVIIADCECRKDVFLIDTTVTRQIKQPDGLMLISDFPVKVCTQCGTNQFAPEHEVYAETAERFWQLSGQKIFEFQWLVDKVAQKRTPHVH